MFGCVVGHTGRVFDYVERYTVRTGSEGGGTNPSLLCPRQRGFGLCRTLHAGTVEKFMKLMLLLKGGPVGCEGLSYAHTHTHTKKGCTYMQNQKERMNEGQPQCAHFVFSHTSGCTCMM